MQRRLFGDMRGAACARITLGDVLQRKGLARIRRIIGNPGQCSLNARKFSRRGAGAARRLTSNEDLARLGDALALLAIGDLGDLGDQIANAV